MIDSKEMRLIEDTVRKMDDIAKSMLDNGVMGLGLSLRRHLDTLKTVIGLENREE